MANPNWVPNKLSPAEQKIKSRSKDNKEEKVKEVKEKIKKKK